MIPANFCILRTASESWITSGLLAVVPVALLADPLCSLIVVSFLVPTLSTTVSNTSLTSFTVSALSNAAITFTFWDSERFWALKILLT